MAVIWSVEMLSQTLPGAGLALHFQHTLSALGRIDMWLVSVSAIFMINIDHHYRSLIQQFPLIIKWLNLIDYLVEGPFT